MRFKKSIIIHQGALGDLINTLPAIQALKENSQTLFAIGSERLKLLKYAGIIDQLFSPHSVNFHLLFMEDFLPSPALKKIFDQAEVVISWLGKHSKTYEQNLKSLAGIVKIFREEFPPRNAKEQFSRILSKPVEELGIEIPSYLPRLILPRADSLPFLRELESPFYLVFHPGAGSEKKRLSREKTIQLINLLAEEFSELALVVILGEAEKSLGFDLTCQLSEKTKSKIKLIQSYDLIWLAQILNNAEIYLGMDSGPTHLASALGTKTVAIFISSNPKIWAPRHPWAKIISVQYPCAPCSDEQRRTCSDYPCVQAIDEFLIIQEIKNLLNLEF